MKTITILFATITLLALAGCADTPETFDTPVRPGLSREALKRRFGEPLRVEPDGAGGENWYYRFASRSKPTEDSGTTVDANGTTTYSSVTINLDKNTGEYPVHLSPDGHVIDPVPEGKIIKN